MTGFNGNFSKEPQFVDPENGSFFLTQTFSEGGHLLREQLNWYPQNLHPLLFQVSKTIFSWEWPTRLYANGLHLIFVRVYDRDGVFFEFPEKGLYVYVQN